MAAPRMMYEHVLDAKKGWIPGNMGSLDKSAKLSANVTIDPVYAGRVAHVDDSDQFQMGVTGSQMAVFLLQNSDDADVSNPGGNNWTAISSQGIMSGIVATSGTELASSEYDSSQTYHVNDLLRAVQSNSNATTGGRLTNAGVTLGTTACCGVVSKVPYTDHNGTSVVQFWPVYVPGTTGN